ncbi:hypothetical protein GQ44DRAFT_709744 [Phaeosphaeriaceae sp. PMI808]|nr:hypothetical protein GQ44DRAFT_709744 [Phaeosphaeriaceae sp. PMI808]
MLAQSTETLISQAQYIKSVADDANSSGNLPITEVCSLHGGIKKLANIAGNLTRTINTLNKTTESSVIMHLKSLGCQRTSTVQQLFSHFQTCQQASNLQVLVNITCQDKYKHKQVSLVYLVVKL